MVLTHDVFLEKVYNHFICQHIDNIKMIGKDQKRMMQSIRNLENIPNSESK